MNSFEGKLLVASPYFRGPVFARRVILILQHSEQGAIGVVLNHPARVPVEQLWQRVSRQPCPVTGTVNLGGPVPEGLVVLQWADADVLSGRTKQWLDIRRGPSSPGARLRLYAGHARWSPGQLEHEVARGIWLVGTATRDLVFADHDALWGAALQHIGRSILASALKTERILLDPSVN